MYSHPSVVEKYPRIGWRHRLRQCWNNFIFFLPMILCAVGFAMFVAGVVA